MVVFVELTLGFWYKGHTPKKLLHERSVLLIMCPIEHGDSKIFMSME